MAAAAGWLAGLGDCCCPAPYLFFFPLLACVPLWRLSFCLVLRFIFLPFFSYLLARRETHEDDQSFFLFSSLFSLCVRFERGRLEQQHMTMALVKRGSVCVCVERERGGTSLSRSSWRDEKSRKKKMRGFPDFVFLFFCRYFYICIFALLYATTGARGGKKEKKKKKGSVGGQSLFSLRKRQTGLWGE